MVRFSVHQFLRTGPMVRFLVLKNTLLNQTEPNLTIPSSWLNRLTLTLRLTHSRKTGSFYLALLAINYRSENIIFQVSTYSGQHISRKRIMRGMHVFSLSGGGIWSAAPSMDKGRYAKIKLLSGLAISWRFPACNGIVFPAPVSATTKQSRPRISDSAASSYQSYGNLPLKTSLSFRDIIW